MKIPTPSQMRCGLFTLSIVGLASIAASAQTPTPTPVSNGKIVFESERDGNREIYVMDANGSNQTNLTNNMADDYHPAWSPNGTKIAFTSVRNGNFEIYLMDANGSNQTRLTNNPTEDSLPAWAPNGTKLAFVSARDFNYEIYAMDANGANQVRLTTSPDSDVQPDWSPDGSKIAFLSHRDGNNEIYVMDANGSNQVRLTNNADSDYAPAWSPDGTKIAFVRLAGSADDIYVMDANGSNQTNLTNNPGGSYQPAWSPDGTKIAFATGRSGDLEIYVMASNGLNPINLTNNTADEGYPSWQRVFGIATPTPSPTPAAQAVNLSTRMNVRTGDNVGIGGFIIQGTAPKHVLLRAMGPSITGLSGVLADSVLELHGPAGFITVINNNWQDDPAQAVLIQASGLAPTNNLEAAIDAPLNPGAYTGVVRGNGGTTGIGLVEVYDLSQAVLSKLANISTRAFVSTGDDIVIAGFILGNQSGNDRIVVRGIGPSLTPFGVPDVLADPTLELRDSNGALLIENNDWQDDPAQAAELTASGLAPTNPVESGIAATLPPGAYTALLAGLNNGTGNGVVEVYDRGAP